MFFGLYHGINIDSEYVDAIINKAQETYISEPTTVFRLQVPDVDRALQRDIEIALNATELGGGLAGIICANIRYAFRNVKADNVKTITVLTRKIMSTFRDYDRSCLNPYLGDINILTSLVLDCHVNKDRRSLENLTNVIGPIRRSDVHAVCFACLEGFDEMTYAFTEYQDQIEYSYIIVSNTGDKYTNMSANYVVGFAPLVLNYEEKVEVRVNIVAKLSFQVQSILKYANALGCNASTLYYKTLIDNW